MSRLLLYLPRSKNDYEPWYRRYSLIRAGIYDVTYDITKADVIATPHIPYKKDYILYYSDFWKDFDEVIANAKVVFACRPVLYEYAKKLNKNTIYTHNGTWIDSGPITDRTGPLLAPYGNWHKLTSHNIPGVTVTRQPESNIKLEWLRKKANCNNTDWIDVHDFYKYRAIVLASEVNDFTKAQDNIKYYDGLAQGLPMFLYTNGTSFTTNDPYVFDKEENIIWPSLDYVEQFRIDNNWKNIFKEEMKYV